MNRFFLTVLSFVAVIFSLSNDNLSASSDGKCSLRPGPTGPQGAAGTDGATGATGATGAPMIYPTADNELTFTIFPFTNTSGDGTWHAFVLAPDQTIVGDTGPISLTSPPANIVLHVGPPSGIGLYTIVFYLDTAQTALKYLVQTDHAVVVTNTGTTGQAFIDTYVSADNSTGVRLKNEGDNFQLFFNTY